MEYTKGEWEAVKSPFGDWGVLCGDVIICRGARHFNAHLIAKSPRMYEALKKITTIEQNDCPYDKYDVLGAINIAKEAIAKAENK